MLCEFDEKEKNIPHVLRRKMVVINTVMTAATAEVFIARSQNEHLKPIDLNSSYFVKSPFRRMGFTKRACTNSKPEISELAKKKAKRICQHQITDLVEHDTILPTLIMNFDQTPLKYTPVANQKLSKTGSKRVAIKGLSFRQYITAISGINFPNKI